jgi:enoyl-CoA hydratase/carnithine racemase
MNDGPILLRNDSNGIATLTLNQPKKLNVLSTELMALIQSNLEQISTDLSIRVVIIAGNGKAFCAGHDLKEMMDSSEAKAMRELFTQCSKMMLTLTSLPQPVIAKVQGVATAAGCQLVAQCDLAIASSAATFATSGIGVGLFCGTPSVAVTRNIPRKQAMELLMTGEFINAEKAQSFGMINHVVEPDMLGDAVENLAQKISTKGPAFVANGKKLFYTQIESGMEAAYVMATECMVENMQMPSTKLGLQAFIDKKPLPKW